MEATELKQLKENLKNLIASMQPEQKDELKRSIDEAFKAPEASKDEVIAWAKASGRK
jgi:secreted trypsin-like serine protease